jgi:integral membrane protein (TIGR01906 family)
MAEVAEQVRGYVVDDDGRNLPAAVDGRPAFDDAAVSHLLDVRHVLEVVHILSGVLALVLVLGLVFEVARKRTMLIAEALAAGAVWSVALVAGCIVVALLDFDWFFSAFHRLFFDSGTWTFPGDSLLILTFPEPFWVTAGAVWGGLILAGAGVFAVAAQALWRGNSKALR